MAGRPEQKRRAAHVNDAVKQARSTLARELIEVVEAVISNMRTLPANETTPEGRRDRAYLDAMGEGADDALSALRAKCKELGVEVGDDYECDGVNCPPRAHDHKVLL